MNALMALILGAAPAPTFDVPIREVSLVLDGQQIIKATPGRCEMWAGRRKPTRVTARLNALHAHDLSSLLMVSLAQGLDATTWIGDAERPLVPAIEVTVISEAAPGSPVFGWSNTLTLTANHRLFEAWRLYGLFSYCNLGEAVDVWMRLMDSAPPRRSLVLALAQEWMIWANRDEEVVYSLHEWAEEYRTGHHDDLPVLLRWSSENWADSPSPRCFATLERSPPVEPPVNP